jgi:hypothetical protein
MTWQKVGLYYVLAAVLGSYFFLFEWNPYKRSGLVDPNAPQILQSHFLPISREDIHEFILKRADLSLLFRRDGQYWTVVEPAGVEVSSDLLTSFVEELTPTKEVTIIDSAPQDTVPFGLNPPNTTIVIKNNTGKDIATVSLGGQNPTSSAIYARIEPSPQVYLLGYSVAYYAQLVFEKVGSEQQH